MSATTTACAARGAAARARERAGVRVREKRSRVTAHEAPGFWKRGVVACRGSWRRARTSVAASAPVSASSFRRSSGDGGAGSSSSSAALRAARVAQADATPRRQDEAQQ
jgi:hypothetical protein